MPINNERIKNYEKNQVKNVICKNVEKVNMELLLTLNETLGILQSKKCKDAVPYIAWNDFVNYNGTLAQKNAKTYNRYVWGRKLFVDFGMTNIQTELSYPHPAILLYNFANTAIVVPITSDDKASGFANDIEECIIKVKSDDNIFPHDSIINIHQICSIHKERIIRDLGCNIKNFIVDSDEVKRLNSYENFRVFNNNINLLDCINLKIMSVLNAEFLNDTFIEEAYNMNEKITLSNRIQELELEKEKLEKECINLKNNIDITKKQ